MTLRLVHDSAGFPIKAIKTLNISPQFLSLNRSELIVFGAEGVFPRPVFNILFAQPSF